MVDAHTDDHIIAEAVIVIGVVPVLMKFSGRSVKIDQSTSISSDPKISFVVFDKTIYIIIWQAGGFGSKVAIQREFYRILVVIINSLFVSAGPYNAGIIVKNGINAVLAETLVI